MSFIDRIGPHGMSNSLSASMTSNLVLEIVHFSMIEKWTISKTKFEVMDALNEFDIPCGPILSMKDIYEDKELYERGMLVEIDHPTRGRYVQVGMPIKLSDSPADVQRSPLLGEHTEEVLAWLGYDTADIKAMKEEGAV